MEEHYYHMFANGDDAKNFITEESEFRTAFNRFGVCQYRTGVKVLSFSVEDSHPHALLHGTYEDCLAFKDLYQDLSLRSIARRRGSQDGVNLNCEIYRVSSEQYLMNVAAYTIIQATKDGKSIMPYDYLYGTGPLYFRSRHTVLPWLINDAGEMCTPCRIADLTVRERLAVCATRAELPQEWLVCNGFILPTNYIDVKGFEKIFRTHNCFRVFLSSNKSKDEPILEHMAEARGILIEDLEARQLCRQACQSLFNKESTRPLSPEQRISLARHLRHDHHLSIRQLSFLTHISELELRKYIR